MFARHVTWTIGVAAGLLTGVASANPVARALDLYEGRAIITGTDDRQRLEGFDHCLRDVLVKVSGNPALLGDARVVPFEVEAESVAEDFAYQDRMSDVPLHDEQGTRDRPYELSVRFAPEKIDAILAKLGEKPWLAVRPPLVLQIMIRRDGSSFPLTADDFRDERLREAAIAAGDKYGMRVVLRPKAVLAAPPPVPGAVPLRGTLTWSPAEFGWVGAWRLRWGGRDHDWGISGVSFDEAFRDAVRGAMQLLAGKGN